MKQTVGTMVVDNLVGLGMGLVARKHFIKKYGSMSNVPKKSIIALIALAFATGVTIEAVNQVREHRIAREWETSLSLDSN